MGHDSWHPDSLFALFFSHCPFLKGDLYIHPAAVWFVVFFLCLLRFCFLCFVLRYLHIYIPIDAFATCCVYVETKNTLVSKTQPTIRLYLSSRY
jgi:hypothetical protein